MARFKIDGLEGVQQAINKREEATMKAIPAMLKAGAKVLVTAQRKQATAMFKGDRSTGDLAQSIKAGGVKGNEDAQYIEVYPYGKDRHGVSNATKGFVQEYGRSNMAARPWHSTANEKSGDKVTEAMRKEWEAAQNG